MKYSTAAIKWKNQFEMLSLHLRVYAGFIYNLTVNQQFVRSLSIELVLFPYLDGDDVLRK